MTGWRSVVVVGVAWLVAGGCSSGGGAAPDGGAGSTGRGGVGGAATGGGGTSGTIDGGAGGTAGPGNDAGTAAACAPVPALGPTWTQMPAPPADVSGLQVTDAWPAGTDDFFFAGSFPDVTGASSPAGFSVLRWTGGCWTIELLQKQAAAPRAPQIAGTATDDVWLTVGNAIYHRDAQTWTPLDNSWSAAITPITMYGAPTLTDVQPRTRDEIWFATEYAMLRLSGGQFQSWELTSGPPGQSASITFFFNRVWISGANDIWAAGGSDQIGNTMDPASLYHFDGNTWTIHNVGAYGVNAIWPGAAGGQFWLAMPPDAVDPRTIRFFNGSSVTNFDVAGWTLGVVEATSLWGRTPTDVYAAGLDVAHYDGTSWAQTSGTPDTARDTTLLRRGSVITGDTTATWLSGIGPTFYRQAAPHP